jgi:hypothetical protein
MVRTHRTRVGMNNLSELIENVDDLNLHNNVD